MPPAKERLTIACATCGKIFYRLPCQMEKGRGRYCSRECGNIGKKTGDVLYCEWCDSAFYRFRSEQDIGQKVRQFCSQPCYAAWRTANRSPGTYPKSGARHLHRIVAESVLGRPLMSGEVVHHLDENKANHDPSNLVVFPDQAHHARCHFGEMSDEELRRFSLTETARRS